jgi:hypothetical protein
LTAASLGQNLGIARRPVADRMAEIEPRQPFGIAPGLIGQRVVWPRILEEDESFGEREDRAGEFAFLLSL